MEPAGLCGRCTGVAVPLRTHVARLEFPRETGLILRCAGKAGNPFQTTQGLSRSVVSDSCDPIDCSLPGSSVHGISQARILEWVAVPSPGDFPDPGIEPRFPALQANTLPSEPPGKPQGKSLALQADTLPSEPLGVPDVSFHRNGTEVAPHS